MGDIVASMREKRRRHNVLLAKQLRNGLRTLDSTGSPPPYAGTTTELSLWRRVTGEKDY